MPEVHDPKREALPLMRSLPDMCGVPAVIWEDAFCCKQGRCDLAMLYSAESAVSGRCPCCGQTARIM